MKIRNSKSEYYGLTFIATSKETNGKYFLSQTIVLPGETGSLPHFHTKEEEGFYIIQGNLTFVVNGHEKILKTGDFINVEKGEIHFYRNDTNYEIRLMIIFQPAGIENMFIELDKNDTHLVEIGRRFGTEFLKE